jgi:hypothetical protein
MLEDSWILEPCSAAYLTSLLVVIGTSDSWGGLEVAGKRKGSDPVGEAWLFEETRR